MNNILNRIIDIEQDLHALITDIQIEVEPCGFNEEAILESLISASVNISHVYKLNKANFNETEEPFKSKLELYDKIGVPFTGINNE